MNYDVKSSEITTIPSVKLWNAILRLLRRLLYGWDPKELSSYFFAMVVNQGLAQIKQIMIFRIKPYQMPIVIFPKEMHQSKVQMNQ
jgi:hypothetical protein